MAANLYLVKPDSAEFLEQSSHEVLQGYPEKYGVEVELLAPSGLDRRALAQSIAVKLNGLVEPFFHLDSEPSYVKDKPVFYHLTQAFQVVDLSGEMLLQCLDDITLQEGLEKSTKPKEGWYRILSDDIRLLRLAHRHANPNDSIDKVLGSIACLFGVDVDAAKGGVYRVADEAGASIALAAPLPGERERPCELVTAPLAVNNTQALQLYLQMANELSFEIPVEGATHFHFDGAFFSNPSIFLKTVRFLHQYRLVLRRMMNTNLNCRRIGDWPHDFLELIKTDELLQLDWEDCRKRVAETGITKYCDFNLRNLIYTSPHKHTLEIRMLPATLDSEMLLRMLRCFNAIFLYLHNEESFEYQRFMEPNLQNANTMLAGLTLSVVDREALGAAFS